MKYRYLWSCVLLLTVTFFSTSYAAPDLVNFDTSPTRPVTFPGDTEVIQIQQDITFPFLLTGWWTWWGVDTGGQVESHVRLMWYRATSDTEVEIHRIGPHKETVAAYDYTASLVFPSPFQIQPGDYLKVELVCVNTGGPPARCHARGALFVDW